jgi:hypothetical protein
MPNTKNGLKRRIKTKFFNILVQPRVRRRPSANIQRCSRERAPQVLDNMRLTCHKNIKEGIEGHPVKWFSDVFDLVFPNLDKDVANNLWKE